VVVVDSTAIVAAAAGNEQVMVIASVVGATEMGVVDSTVTEVVVVAVLEPNLE